MSKGAWSRFFAAGYLPVLISIVYVVCRRMGLITDFSPWTGFAIFFAYMLPQLFSSTLGFARQRDYGLKLWQDRPEKERHAILSEILPGGMAEFIGMLAVLALILVDGSQAFFKGLVIDKELAALGVAVITLLAMLGLTLWHRKWNQRYVERAGQ